MNTITGKRMGDGTVTLISQDISDLSARVLAAKRKWPWSDMKGVTNGDTRLGISWPYTEERQAGVYKAGAAVLCVADRDGIVYVMRVRRFFIIGSVLRSDGSGGVELAEGLRAAVSEAMLTGVSHYAVQSDHIDMARSYMQQLFEELPGADRLTWDRVADVNTCCARLTSRAEVGQFVQPSENTQQVSDERNDLGGKPGPLEIATAIVSASFEFSPMTSKTESKELKSLYALPKGARVFGGG